LCRDAHRPPEAIRHYEAALGHYRLAGESEAHILPVVAGKLAELYRANGQAARAATLSNTR
nr:hypothetical protein [Calditrichia bacterium]